MSSFESESGVGPYEIRAGLREIEVGKYGRDAMGRRALVLAFGTVAGVELEGFLCRCGESYFATLAASLHTHYFGCM